MQKDATGVWSATTAPLRPDLYAYSFDVDGVSILDPSNTRLRPSYRRIGQSAVLVPGDMPWTPLPNVPRGVVSRHVFQSRIANDERDFFVYTQPNYDPKRRQPYPVLILQHGLGDEANAWIDVGGANVTLDTLINQGKAVPMIMVNTHGYGTAAGPADVDRLDMLPTYIRILLEEVLPQVEKQYNVSTQRTDRAIAGLSMGGAEAMYGGLNNLDKFAWLGSFSGAFNLWPLTRPARETAPQGTGATATPGPVPDAAPAGGRPRFTLVESQLPAQFPKLDAKSNAQIKLLWIACGTADAGALPTNRQFKKYLDSKGVKVTYTETPDIGHVWPFWRLSLAEFAPLLFR
jgi:enterochelin esterase-like enzyme